MFPYDSLEKLYAYCDSIYEVNQEMLFFSDYQCLSHFRKLFHSVSIESLLIKKLFGEAPSEFSLEAAPRVLPNKP
jgi:hypothetical protein